MNVVDASPERQAYLIEGGVCPSNAPDLRVEADLFFSLTFGVNWLSAFSVGIWPQLIKSGTNIRIINPRGA